LLLKSKISSGGRGGGREGGRFKIILKIFKKIMDFCRRTAKIQNIQKDFGSSPPGPRHIGALAGGGKAAAACAAAAVPGKAADASVNAAILLAAAGCRCYGAFLCVKK